METTVTKYVIDACSLIAYLRGEEGEEKFRALLKSQRTERFIHAVNLGEVYYDSIRYAGLSEARNLIDEILRLPITVVWELDMPFLEKVGHYKTAYRVSYADCFVLALAEQEQAMVVSTDHHEFDAVDKAKVLNFYWLR